MKKILFLFGLVSFLLICVGHVSAHSADVAYVDIYAFLNNNGQQLGAQRLEGILSISWVQMSYLAKDYLAEDLPASEQKIPHQAYAPYLSEHLLINNDGSACTTTFGEIPKTQDSQIIFGKGLPVPFQIDCEKPIHKLSLTSTMFLDNFPLHSTVLTIFSHTTKITDTILTKSYQTFSFTPVLPQPTVAAEKKPQVSVLSLQSTVQTVADQLFKKGNTSLPLAIVFVFCLGILHTLEAGHSKTVLASYVLNKRVSLKRALSFAGVFTFTHLADIFILGIFFLITNTFVDLYAKLSLLNIVALYVLLGISIYMIFKTFGDFVKHTGQHRNSHSHTHDDHEHTHPWEEYPNDLKKQLSMAFLIGLSPCIFGWSIFMVIISLRQAWTVLPILVAFGLGIFIALALLVVIVMKIKLKLSEKFHWIGELSPVLSYVLLAMFALQALLK